MATPTSPPPYAGPPPVCRKHLRWLGNGIDHAGQQISLDGQPAIINANATHRRLARNHRRENPVRAYRLAYQVCQNWRDRFERQEQFSEIVTALRPGQRLFAFNDPAVHAARYPQIVAVTAVLVSARWQALAHEQWERPEQLLRHLWPTSAHHPYPAKQHRPDTPLIEILLNHHRELLTSLTTNTQPRTIAHHSTL